MMVKKHIERNNESEEILKRQQLGKLRRNVPLLSYKSFPFLF